jgi:glycerol-3-phosphate acyltransferase PlsX
MGGDYAPEEPVKGAIDAVLDNPKVKVFLVGIREQIERELKKYQYPKEQIEVIPATEVIATAEPPVEAIRTKKDSSIVLGLTLVKEKKADAFVSAGNSGAVLAGGTMIVRRLKGIHRAPFAPLIPTAKGPAILLDSGANVDARSAHLVQFAHLGSIYMESVLGRKNPTVGLVNIGAEDEKGNALTKETFPLLKKTKGINFIGNLEAREIPKGGAEVIVAEAFVGNVILKMYEGVGSVMLQTIKSGLMSSFKSKIGALLSKSALKKSLKQFDVTEYGGAPLLGLRGLVVKAHGSAKAKEFRNTILQCITFKEQNINGKIQKYLEAEKAVEKEAREAGQIDHK